MPFIYGASQQDLAIPFHSNFRCYQRRELILSQRGVIFLLFLAVLGSRTSYSFTPWCPSPNLRLRTSVLACIAQKVNNRNKADPTTIDVYTYVYLYTSNAQAQLLSGDTRRCCYRVKRGDFRMVRLTGKQIVTESYTRHDDGGLRWFYISRKRTVSRTCCLVSWAPPMWLVMPAKALASGINKRD